MTFAREAGKGHVSRRDRSISESKCRNGLSNEAKILGDNARVPVSSGCGNQTRDLAATVVTINRLLW